jgi:NAD(P)H-hydrate repair Nnr-like enzyme with NAD(P)H-hydrate dehydratase domain
MPRMHSIVIGPGLGRNPHLLDAIFGIVNNAKQSGKK